MLELGVQSGGSLEMWKYYFGSQIEVHGVDINPLCLKFDDPARNISVHLGSASDSALMSSLARRLAPIDFVIDDASHHSPDILAAFAHLYPALRMAPPGEGAHRDGGIYMVEDLLSNYWISAEFQEGAQNADTFVNNVKRMVDRMHVQYAKNFTDQDRPGKNRPGRRWVQYLPEADEYNLSKTLLGIHVYDKIVVLEKGRLYDERGKFYSREVLAGGAKTAHDRSLEHQRPSVKQLKAAREKASQAYQQKQRASPLPAAHIEAGPSLGLLASFFG